MGLAKSRITADRSELFFDRFRSQDSVFLQAGSIRPLSLAGAEFPKKMAQREVAKRWQSKPVGNLGRSRSPRGSVQACLRPFAELLGAQ